MIPAYKYRREPGDAAAAGEKGGSDESQCAVCLSAFAEGEDVRRLPKCGQSFHAACIDAWLCARASCPLCRASVLAAAPPQSAPGEATWPNIRMDRLINYSLASRYQNEVSRIVIK
ncbi:hypothetical protein Taro_001274 [Colocasia esculenta]|uniref:RING-type E3 ubiquitin transferase n=1 Tax=Colocasia esculenta TaxID=4460 RepID=A0A843THJ9_COLES|nr:hypothetical protein [Colocasia esculenta]